MVPDTPDAPRVTDEQARLASVTLHFAAAFAVLMPVMSALSPTGVRLSPGVASSAGMAVFALSLLLCVLARRGAIGQAWIGLVSPAFMVLAAAGISVMEQWHAWPPRGAVLGVSWVCLWIVWYPLVGPRSDVGGLVPAVLAAGTVPGAILGAVAAGARANPEPRVWVAMGFAAVVAAAISVFPAAALLSMSERSRLGNYHLVRRIDQGAMGEVWLARHRLLPRSAAIKLIRPHHLDDSDASGEMERRFQEEAAAISRLSSPHTVGLYDFGVAGDGRFFYVMELLNGLDLRRLVERFGTVSPERAGHLVRQAATSLAEAHAQGLVHRDVKPSNLFVCRVGLEVDFVKVLDFGLVSARGATDEVSGTPAFMAPEVARGGPADARSDVYALGCVLYWLLTGELVFPAPSTPEQIQAHATEEPSPVSERSDVDIPGDFDALVASCLDKDPARRPQTMEALIEGLDACPGERPWTPRAARRWWRGHLPRQLTRSS